MRPHLDDSSQDNEKNWEGDPKHSMPLRGTSGRLGRYYWIGMESVGMKGEGKGKGEGGRVRT